MKTQGKASTSKRNKLKRLPLKKCKNCKKMFRPKRKNQDHHSTNCRKRYWDKKHFLEKMLGFIEKAEDIRGAIKEFMEAK